MKTRVLLTVIGVLFASPQPAIGQFSGASRVSGNHGDRAPAASFAGSNSHTGQSHSIRSTSNPVQHIPTNRSSSFQGSSIKQQQGAFAAGSEKVGVPPGSSRTSTTGQNTFFKMGDSQRGHHGRRHSHHRHLHRQEGIVIIDVPQYVGSGVITQIYPTTNWVDAGFTGSPYTHPGMRFPGQLAPFDPTPQEVVERMLALVNVKKNDVVYDLGSGDGRIVITAAKKYGAKSVGYEIDPGLIKLARENAQKQGVEKLVEFREQDFMLADLSLASVVTLYLSYDGNLALRPMLLRQLKPGARVVSYMFDMGDWQPKIVESFRDSSRGLHALYYWEIGGPLVFSDNAR